MNRVQMAISRYEAKIAGLNGVGLNGTPLDDFEAGLKLSFEDFVGYQNAQSQAFVTGRISAEEAMTIFQALGGDGFHGDWPKGTTLATKVAITQVVGELILKPVKKATGYRR
jgi:hypothetical protein